MSDGLATYLLHSWDTYIFLSPPFTLLFISLLFLFSCSSFVSHPLESHVNGFLFPVVGLARRSPFVDIRRTYCLKPAKPPSPRISPIPNYHETACCPPGIITPSPPRPLLTALDLVPFFCWLPALVSFRLLSLPISAHLPLYIPVLRVSLELESKEVISCFDLLPFKRTPDIRRLRQPVCG